MTAGTTQSVVLQVYDQYGNKITSGGEAAKIVGTLSPDIPGQNSIGTSDNLDGRYTVNYIIRQATTYTLSVAADAVVLPEGTTEVPAPAPVPAAASWRSESSRPQAPPLSAASTRWITGTPPR